MQFLKINRAFMVGLAGVVLSYGRVPDGMQILAAQSE